MRQNTEAKYNSPAIDLEQERIKSQEMMGAYKKLDGLSPEVKKLVEAFDGGPRAVLAHALSGAAREHFEQSRQDRFSIIPARNGEGWHVIFGKGLTHTMYLDTQGSVLASTPMGGDDVQWQQWRVENTFSSLVEAKATIDRFNLKELRNYIRRNGQGT
jgi:hypothetical protein